MIIFQVKESMFSKEELFNSYFYWRIEFFLYLSFLCSFCVVNFLRIRLISLVERHATRRCDFFQVKESTFSKEELFNSYFNLHIEFFFSSFSWSLCVVNSFLEPHQLV